MKTIAIALYAVLLGASAQASTPSSALANVGHIIAVCDERQFLRARLQRSALPLRRAVGRRPHGRADIPDRVPAGCEPSPQSRGLTLP